MSFSFHSQQGKPSEYFTMILEGRVQVKVGKEKMTFEGGPFTCFGTEFLLSDQGYDGKKFNLYWAKKTVYFSSYSLALNLVPLLPECLKLCHK